MKLSTRKTSQKRCLANMRDGHTCAIGGVNLIGTIVGLVGGKLLKLTRQMVGGASIHVPRRIDGVGRSGPLNMLLSLSRGEGSRGGRGRAKVGELSLAFVALPIVADAQKTALKAAVAL
jgi:hypothetical protein